MAATSDSMLDSAEVNETSGDSKSASPMDEHTVDKVCKIEATVVTGLEHVAREECAQKLGVTPETARGRIFFKLPVERVTEVRCLQGVDNLFVVIETFDKLDVPPSKEEMEAALVPLVGLMHWETALEVWRRMRPEAGFKLADFFHKPQDGPDNAAGDQKEANKDDGGEPQEKEKKAGPKFRVTCHRSGPDHKFTSMEAAATFGGAVNDTFGWGVDMRNFDLEVVLHVDPGCVYVCLALTPASLHHRHLEHFGPTSLRCTIAYNMLMLCDLKPGDIVCDPMVGGGSIPLEGGGDEVMVMLSEQLRDMGTKRQATLVANPHVMVLHSLQLSPVGCVNWPQTAFVCGDNHPLAVQRTHDNQCALNEKRSQAAPEGCSHLCLDVCQWNACALPLRTASVDVFVTDLPAFSGMAPWCASSQSPDRMDTSKMYAVLDLLARAYAGAGLRMHVAADVSRRNHGAQPFGKRMGSRPDNRLLYPRLLNELARAARPRTGRAVLLTQDKKSLSLAVGRVGRLWRQGRVHGVNVGGLSAAIYVLRRTDVKL